MGSRQTVLLRPLRKTDLEAFWAWASDEEVTRFLTWESPKSLGEAGSFLDTGLKCLGWFQAICLEDQVVGSISMAQGKGPHLCRAEIGYVVAREWWGQGVGSAAIGLAAEEGLTWPGVVRIEAYVNPANIASARALEKAGFVREGLLRQSFVRKGIVEDRLVYGFGRKV